MHSNGNWSPRVFLTRKSLGTPKKKKKKKKLTTNLTLIDVTNY